MLPDLKEAKKRSNNLVKTIKYIKYEEKQNEEIL